MFGTLLQKIPEFFSLRFLFGSYLPLLICIAISSGLAWLTFWPVQQWFQGYLKLEDGLLQTLLATSAAIGIAVVAMIFHGMLALVQRILEGKTMPQRLRAWLTRNRSAEFNRLDEQLAVASKARFDFLRGSKGFKDELNSAREQGSHSTQCFYVPDLDLESKCREAIRSVQSRDLESAPPDVLAVKSICDRLAAVLWRNNANAPKKEDEKFAALLDSDHRRFEDLLKNLGLQHDMRVRAFHDAREAQYPFGEVCASRMGAVAASVEGYFETCYGMDYSILWPRLENVVRMEDADMGNALDRIGAQLDFYLTMFWTTLVSWLFWTAVLAIDRITPWLLLAVGMFLPLLAAIWWRMAVITYTNLARQVRVAVDFHRTALAHQLGLTEPKKLSEIQEFWNKETRFLGFGDAHDLEYEVTP